MATHSLADPINEQIERARIAALRNRPAIPADEPFTVDVQVRIYAASWPDAGPARSRSRVIGRASCAYVPRGEGDDGQ